MQQLASKILNNITTGVLYRNPIPHVKSVHGYFPSVVTTPDGELVATYVLAEAFEAVNARLHISRSNDGGRSWQGGGAIFGDQVSSTTSEFGKLSIAPNGELVVNLVRHDRTGRLDRGLANENMGFVPTEILISASRNSGHTWTEPTSVVPPLVGPCFELCSPVVFLRDGRWLLPTSTWMDWHGNLPNGNRMVAFVSEDRGKTWPTYLDVMHSPNDNLIYWESRIVELDDGRLLATAWCYDYMANADRPNQYAISHDGGDSWSEPRSMGLLGQTLAPCLLPDGRLLCVYRRMDRPGLWAVVSHLDGDQWVNEGKQPLWGYHDDVGRTERKDNMVDTFHGLKFGAPSIICLPNDSVFLAFWCYEHNVSIIRWFKAEVR